MTKIEEVVYKLRELYPDLNITLWIKSNRGQLLVNDKAIFKFDEDFIERHLNKFGEEGFRETVKIWAEYVQRRYIQRKNMFDRKPGGRPGLCLTESQIRFATHNTKSNSSAARFLHVAYNTYRKYAKMYNLFDNHKSTGKGIPKGGFQKKVPFEEIFANKHPNYNLHHLKNRLVNEMIIEERCEVCGYNERRVFDGKMGLLLDFKDGNNKNMSRENMRLICFNCKFNIRGKMSKDTLRRIDEQYNKHLIETDSEKVEKVWENLNPKKEEVTPPVIQTNYDEKDDSESYDIDDIWNKFNK